MSPTQTGEFDLQQTLQQADGWRLMLAVHRPTGRTVHLLIFSQELSQLPQFRAALKTDRDTLLQLRHACIQRFLGFAESDGELLCWMEPPEAPSLADTVLLSEGLHPTITSLGMHRWLAAATAAKASLVQPGTGPAIISVSAFASQDQVLTDLRDVALLLKRLLELSRGDQTRKIPAAAGTASARPRLARLLERLIGTDQSTPLTARELQGRMGELLLEGGEMPINDQRDEAAGRRNSIVLNLFDDAALPTPATPQHTSAGSAGRLPKLPIFIAVVVLLLLTLVAALLR